jgi:molybdopterin molybdotransferase
LIPLEEARSRVLDRCQPGHPSAVPLAEVLGCVTSVPLTADGDLPPFASSAVDGWAVRAADVASVPVELDVAGSVRAGEAPVVAVTPGSAVRIMTGAPVPDGADAMVMVEDSEDIGPGRVRIGRMARAGDHVRPAGSDVVAGSELLPAFTELGPAHVGLLAAAGLARAPVFPRVRVGVLSTGDELVGPGRPLGPGQIHDANRPALLAQCRASGFDAVDLGAVGDDESAIHAAVVDGARRCHAVITSGGVSVGDHDHLPAVLARLGMGPESWMQIAIRPAKPFGFGLAAGVPVFALPGNPVSALVSFELLVRPGLRRMMGHRRLDRTRVEATAPEGLPRAPDGKTHFVRVALDLADGGYRVRAEPSQGSHQLAQLARAGGLAIVPDGDGIPPGDRVEVIALAYP